MQKVSKISAYNKTLHKMYLPIANIPYSDKHLPENSYILIFYLYYLQIINYKNSPLSVI